MKKCIFVRVVLRWLGHVEIATFWGIAAQANFGPTLSSIAKGGDEEFCRTCLTKSNFISFPYVDRRSAGRVDVGSCFSKKALEVAVSVTILQEANFGEHVTTFGALFLVNSKQTSTRQCDVLNAMFVHHDLHAFKRRITSINECQTDLHRWRCILNVRAARVCSAKRFFSIVATIRRANI